MKVTQKNLHAVIPSNIWQQAESQKASLWATSGLTVQQGEAKFDDAIKRLGLAMRKLNLNAGLLGARPFVLQAERASRFGDLPDAALAAMAIMLAADKGIPAAPVAHRKGVDHGKLVSSGGGVWPGLNNRLSVSAQLYKHADGKLDVKVQERQVRDATGLVFDGVNSGSKWEALDGTAARVPLTKNPDGTYSGHLANKDASVTWDVKYNPATRKMDLHVATEERAVPRHLSRKMTVDIT
jgi:hypothetical protein